MGDSEKEMSGILKRPFLKRFRDIIVTLAYIILLYLFYRLVSAYFESMVSDCYPIIESRMVFYDDNNITPPSFVEKYIERFKSRSSFYDWVAEQQHRHLGYGCHIGANYFLWLIFWPDRMKELYSDEQLVFFLLENESYDLPIGKIYGISNATQKYFGKNFPDISEKEFLYLFGSSSETYKNWSEEPHYQLSPEKECVEE